MFMHAICTAMHVFHIIPISFIHNSWERLIPSYLVCENMLSSITEHVLIMACIV